MEELAVLCRHNPITCFGRKRRKRSANGSGKGKKNSVLSLLQSLAPEKRWYGVQSINYCVIMIYIEIEVNNFQFVRGQVSVFLIFPLSPFILFYINSGKKYHNQNSWIFGTTNGTRRHVGWTTTKIVLSFADFVSCHGRVTAERRSLKATVTNEDIHQHEVCSDFKHDQKKIIAT